jgi:hypothetical protein
MIRRERLWKVAVVALVVVLAGPVRQAQAAEKEWAGLAQVWSWFAAVFAWEVTAVHADQCSMIDPEGRCRDGLVSLSAEQCMMIDPNGRCRDTAGVGSDQSSYIDPNG